MCDNVQEEFIEEDSPKMALQKVQDFTLNNLNRLGPPNISKKFEDEEIEDEIPS